jgi:hypothetical protein
MIKVLHFTDFYKALKIMKTKQFIPSETYGDRGLNCFIYGENIKYTNANIIENPNTRMIFEWSGNIEKADINSNPTKFRNSLVDQRPWRAQITPNEGDNLKLVKIICTDYETIDLYLQNNWHYKLLCWTKKQKEAYHIRFVENINKNLKEQLYFIKIVNLT